MTEHTIIIGAGQAGGQAAASLRQFKYEGRITLIGEEAYLPYQRPPLSKAYLAGELEADRLYLKPPAFYEKADISLLTETRIAAIDPWAKTLTSTDGITFSYSKLIIATGAPPRFLDCPGGKLANIYSLRTIEESGQLQKHLTAGTRMVIVGAGYIGLEVAAVARKHGLEVTVLEAEDRVLSRVTCDTVSRFYEEVHRDAGVDIRLGARLTGFDGDSAVEAALLEDGTRLPCDLVLTGIGSVPATGLAEAAGLRCGNGIYVDDYCLTSDPDIYAAGDCTNHPNPLMGCRLRLESVHNAIEQGKTAAAHIAGREMPYAQIPWFWSDQYDLKLQTVGVWSEADETILRGNPATRSFSVFYLKEGKLVCIDAINDPVSFMMGKKAIPAGISPAKEALANPETDIKSVLSA